MTHEQRERANPGLASVSPDAREPSIRPVPAIPENLRIALAGLVAFTVGTTFEAQFGFSPKMWFLKIFGAVLIFYPVVSWLWHRLAGRSLGRDLGGTPTEKAINLTEWIERNRAVLIIGVASAVVAARLFLHT